VGCWDQKVRVCVYGCVWGDGTRKLEKIWLQLHHERVHEIENLQNVGWFGSSRCSKRVKEVRTRPKS
jgi:hypothetical protein